jgi:hypothetical protein
MSLPSHIVLHCRECNSDLILDFDDYLNIRRVDWINEHNHHGPIQVQQKPNWGKEEFVV